MNEEPLFGCMQMGIPSIEKIEHKHLITVGVLTLVHGIAKGNIEHSSTTVRMNLFRVTLGNAPLKSILSRSNDCVASTRLESIGLKKRGIHSAQIFQEAVMALLPPQKLQYSSF